MMNITVDEADNESISRSEVYNSLKEGLQDYLEESLVVLNIGESSITITDNEGGPQEVSILDPLLDNDPHLKLIANVLIASYGLVLPEVVLLLDQYEEGDDLVLELVDSIYRDYNSELKVNSLYEHDIELSISARYLLNKFKEDGIIVVKDDKIPDYIVKSNKSVHKLALVTLTDAASQPVVTSENVQFVDDPERMESDATDEVLDALDKEESTNFTNTAQLKRYRKLRARKLRLLRIKRRKDPVGYRKRALAARLRWRKNRNSYIRGLKRYKRTNKFKKLVSTRSDLSSTGVNVATRTV